MIPGEFCWFGVHPFIHHAWVLTLFVITVNLAGHPASQQTVLFSIRHCKLVDLAGVEPASVTISG